MTEKTIAADFICIDVLSASDIFLEGKRCSLLLARYSRFFAKE
jgi:hypothetical protein